MIGNLIKGRGARGLLDYLLAARDHKGKLRPVVRLVGGTVAGRTPRQIAAEFDALHALRPRLGVHVLHEVPLASQVREHLEILRARQADHAVLHAPSSCPQKVREDVEAWAGYTVRKLIEPPTDVSSPPDERVSL